MLGTNKKKTKLFNSVKKHILFFYITVLQNSTKLRLPNKLFTNKLETIDLYFADINRIVSIRDRVTKYN